MNSIGLVSMVAIASVATGVGSALAQVQRPPTQGLYAGGAIGYGGYRTNYNRTNDTIAATGATAWTVSGTQKNTMWKAYVGYRFTPFVSIEGGYWDFGGPSYSAAIAAPITTTISRRFSAKGAGADAVLWLPLSAVSASFTNVSGFVKVGAMQTYAEASAAVPGGGLTPLPDESSNNLRPHWGVGVEYALQPNWAARLEYEAVNKVGDESKFGAADIQLWSLGANFRF